MTKGVICIVLFFPLLALAQSTTKPAEPREHPALFLVGDSIMRTGTNGGVTGPWGWGYEIVSMFDSSKIHIYNQGLGGRSSRGYIEEGAWAKLLPDIAKGDYVLVEFGHNDAADSQNYPNRMTAPGNGDDLQQVTSKVTGNSSTVHSYGWYLRQYVQDAKAKGATVIVCSSIPRNQWADGKIKRGFDGYAEWAEQAAKQSGAIFMPLNEIAANHYDALGQEETKKYFNDIQHTKKIGAQLNAKAVVEGLKQLKDCPLADDLLPVAPEATTRPAALVPASSIIYAVDDVGPTTAPVVKKQPTTAKAFALNPKLRTLFVIGDSTAAKGRAPIQGWGEPFLSYFDPAKINAVNASRGGRSSRTFMTDGSFKNVLDQVKPGDIVLVQFGHNDVFPLNDNVARGTLHGLGENTVEIDNVATKKHEVVHTFGWYMRQMVIDIRTKGATPILLTLTVRDRFNADGTIERLPDPKVDLADTNRFTAPPMWSEWTAEVAKSEFVPLLDVHNKIADRDDQQGRAVAETYYNSARDPTHRNAKGAEADAQDTLSCLRALQGSSFDDYLSDAGKAIPAADPKYVIHNDDPLAMPGTRRPFEITGNQGVEQDSPTTPRTGKLLIVLAGDSTVTYSAGWAAGFKTHVDPQVQVINLSHGGRTTATFRSDGRWDQMLALKPDYVLIQFGHNDEGFMSLETYSANLARFVDEARAAGVKPILITPVSRRYWQADNKIHSELGPSAEAMKKVAADKNVPLLDLHSAAIELYERAGKSVNDTWALSKPNPDLRRATTHPTTMPDEVLDKTHFNAQGSKAVGAVVAAKLKELVPELAPYID